MNVGKWEARKDTIVFHSIAKGSVKAIDTVIATGLPGDSITVTILDKNGNNVTSRMAFRWHVRGIGYYTQDGMHKSNSVPGAMVLVRTRPAAYLELQTVKYFLGASCEIDVTKASNFVVKLGIDESVTGGNYYPALSYGNPEILIKKGDTLSEQFEHPLMNKYGRVKEK